MYKFIALLALVACVMAAPKPGYLASPAVAVAHSVPLATSYSNSYINNPFLATAPAYAYAAQAAPVAYATAPAAHLTYAAAPAAHLAYAAQAAPLAYTAQGTHLSYAATPVFKYY